MAMIPWRAGATPGHTVASLRKEMNDLVNRFWSGAAEPFGLAEWAPPMDVSETADAVLVHVEVPGIDPKDIDITVTGDVLTLRGEKRDQTRRQGRDYTRIERRYGAFTRSLPLPASVDAEKVEATARNGVLEVRLPKREEARSRRIEIAE